MALDRDISLTWLGHATFLIETPGGRTVLIDPWVEHNPACPPDRLPIPGAIRSQPFSHLPLPMLFILSPTGRADICSLRRWLSMMPIASAGMQSGGRGGRCSFLGKRFGPQVSDPVISSAIAPGPTAGDVQQRKLLTLDHLVERLGIVRRR